MRKYKLVPLVLSICLSSTIFADETSIANKVVITETADVSKVIMEGQYDNYPIVDFTTVYSQEIPRDVMIVTLFVQKEAKTLVEISGQITSELNQAVDIAKSQGLDDIVTQRNSYIRYDKNGEANGWVDRAELSLSGNNFETIAKVISQLEGKMAVQDMRFDISKQQKKELEEIMTQEALQAFKQKAQLMSRELGAKDYQIVSLNVSNVNEYSSPRPVMYQKMASVASSDVMQLESGKSDVQVSIAASIRLLP